MALAAVMVALLGGGVLIGVVAGLRKTRERRTAEGSGDGGGWADIGGDGGACGGGDGGGCD